MNPIDNNQEPDEPSVVPFTRRFSAPSLAKNSRFNEDEVLSRLLEMAQDAPSVDQLKVRIGDAFLAGRKGRKDIQRFVYYGLIKYGLVEVDASTGIPALTETGSRLLEVTPPEQDVEFAKHILLQVNGVLICETILTYQRRGETPTLEQLSYRLTGQHTATGLSDMRSWLVRAGVLVGAGYTVDERRFDQLVGETYEAFAGIPREEFEFVLQARVAQLATGQPDDALAGQDVRTALLSRRPELFVPGKSLDKFLERIEKRGLIARVEKQTGTKGGTKNAFTLTHLGLARSNEELESLIGQTSLGFPVTRLRSFTALLSSAGAPNLNAFEIGRIGEEMSVHVCFALGLRVVGRNVLTPNAELDIVAERTAGLAYQRWVIQAKNYCETTTVRTKHIDREIGAVAGTSVTHILFIMPRAQLTPQARGEVCRKSALTHLNIFFLDADTFGQDFRWSSLARDLERQAKTLAALKAQEARLREDG